MDQVDETTSAEGGPLRRLLFLSVCEAIWQYRKCIIPNGDYDEEEAKWKYPTTPTKLLETIESLLRMPYDLLSMKFNIRQAAETDFHIFPGINRRYLGRDFEKSIIHWACNLGVVDVIHLILNLDPDQAKDSCIPLRYILRSEAGNNLQLIQHLYDSYPDAIAMTNRRNGEDLALHTAIVEDRSVEVVEFLLQKFPQAVRIQNDRKLLPMCYIHQNVVDMERKHRVLIDAYPQGLGHRCGIGVRNRIYMRNGLYMHSWLVKLHDRDFSEVNSMVKLSFEDGKKLNVFEKDVVYGLFETVTFDVQVLARAHGGNEWVNMYVDYFQVDFQHSAIRKRTTLELFLYHCHNNLDEPMFTNGWDEARYVFQAARDTAILQPAIGRVQDDFLPIMIDKFDIDLMQPDEYGRSPLIVSIYHTVFTAINEDDGDPMSESNIDTTEMYSLAGLVPINKMNVEVDTVMDDANDSTMEYFQGENEHSDELSNASMILSSRRFTYTRRTEEQSLKCDVIAMMLGHNGTSIDINIVDNGSSTNHNPATVTDSNGRYPLHVGAEIGLKWHNGLKTILDAYSVAVEVPDPKSGLYAFMLAALGDNYDLNAVFNLFLEQPDLLETLDAM